VRRGPFALGFGVISLLFAACDETAEEPSDEHEHGHEHGGGGSAGASGSSGDRGGSGARGGDGSGGSAESGGTPGTGGASGSSAGGSSPSGGASTGGERTDGGSGSDPGAGGEGGSEPPEPPGPPVVNGCAAYDDRTAPAAGRSVTWDYGISEAPERCVRISLGQSVTWLADFELHPLEISPFVLGSYDAAGDTYTATFTQPGAWGFVCTAHSEMNGAVWVTP
jgi:hypothetical protein